MEPEHYHIQVSSNSDYLSLLSPFLKEHIDRLGDEHLALSIELVAEELVTNIFRHGYREQDGPVDITLDFESASITLTIEDCAPAFNPLIHVDSEVGMTEGLRGITLVHHLSDTVEYTRTEDGHNIICCTFRSPAGSACFDPSAEGDVHV